MSIKEVTFFKTILRPLVFLRRDEMVFLKELLRGVISSLVIIFFTLKLSVSTPVPNNLLHGSVHSTEESQETVRAIHKEDEDILMIAQRDYETEHGRILAVNMAHQRKRDASKNKTKDGNSFANIEKVNDKEMHLGLYQGDIILDPELKKMIEDGKKGRVTRNAIRQKKRLWMTRIIPYYIPSFMSHIRGNLMKAINQFHRHTCLRFVPYRGQRNYIKFGKSYGCSSKVGIRYATPGAQAVSLADGCNWVGTILHELTHAVGFFHEQSRSDRNRYVEIKWENIIKGASDQYDRYSWRTIDDLGKNYDFRSIMHYDRRAFTKNGKPTIVAIHNPSMEFGMPGRGVFSPLDIIEINALYNCRRKRFGWSEWSAFTPCDKKCYKTRERYCYHSGNIKSCGGNTNVYGIESQRIKCPKGTCPAPIDGHWGRWSDWSKCNAYCDNGIRKRFRRCDNPTPMHGGKYCVGKGNSKDVCVLRRCRLGFDDTDFENFRLGMWKNSVNDELQWQFHTGPTQTMNTGPSYDHTTAKGYYLYVESSAAIRRRGNAKLVSPWLPGVSGGQCIKFWYFMYGKNMGTLWIKIDIQGGVSYLLFYKKRDQGNKWNYGVGNINTDGRRYKLTIEATIGRGYSDIAIDDVYIDSGMCNCQDKYVSCAKWGRKGDCQKNAKWMADHCKRTCKKCHSTPKPKPCIDKNKVQCPLWARQNECQKNPGYMNPNCAKSCKQCVGTTPKPKPCKDKDPVQCPLWAQRNECQKNPGYMNPNCAKSCKQCVGWRNLKKMQNAKD